MLVPLSILKKFLDTDAKVEDICSALTDLGLEVEGVQSRFDLEPFIVAEIIEFQKHPNADKLNVCKVDNGNEVLQIVCGAPNVREKMKVVLAPIGAKIPRDGMEIKRAKIRDVESCGMLCSASELLLGMEGNGIIDLPQHFVVGKKYSSQAGLDDPIIDVSLTPNRGDCASVYGVARDLAASGIGKFTPINTQFCGSKNLDKNNFLWGIPDEECKKIGLLKMEGVLPVESPAWLRQDLEKFGIKPRNLPVDITNYIMMVYGQPMHCYDADKICGKIVAKKLQQTTQLIDLKGEVRTLEAGDLAIYDDNKILGIAGIIGGLESSVSESTQNIILEAAYFDKNSIAKTGQRLGIVSDARFRFERGVDYAMVDFALDTAAEIITNAVKDAKMIKKDVFGCSYDSRNTVKYNPIIFQEITGIICEAEIQKAILHNLGFNVEEINVDNWIVSAPSYRHDINVAADLVEEILRIKGYSSVPLRPIPYFSSLPAKAANEYKKIIKLKKQIAGFGYDEVITFAFQDLKLSTEIRYNNMSKLVELYNPIISSNSVMRQSLLPGLLNLALSIFNNEKQENIQIFEYGSVFLDEMKFENKSNIAFLASGHFGDRDYTNSQEKASWLLAKTHIYSMLEVLGYEPKLLIIEPCELDFGHPYRSFFVQNNGKKIAAFGEFNPAYLSKRGFSHLVAFGEIFACNEIELNKCLRQSPEIEHHPIFRDFSFILPNDIKLGNLLAEIAKLDHSISFVNLNDVYKNNDWKGVFSAAISVSIQQNKVMTTQEIDAISSKIINLAVENFGGKLRDGISD